MAQEMKDSGVKWIGEIPTNWKIDKMKYLVNGYKSGPFGSSLITGDLLPEGTILVYTPEHIASGELEADTTNLYLPDNRRTEMSQFFVKSGEIVFPIVGSLGRALLVKDGMPEGIINQRLAKFSIDRNRIDERYFMWIYGKSQFYAKYIELYCRGSIIVNLTKNLIGNMPVPLPSLPEQQAIADFLDAKCAEIDGLLADLDAEVKTLAEYKKSIIAETVTHGLNPNVTLVPTNLGWIDSIPEHWGLEKAKYAFELRKTKGNIKNLELLSPTQKYGVIPQSQLDGVVLVNEKTNLETFRTIHAGDFCISLRSFQGGFEYSTYEGVVSPAYQVFYPTIDVCDGYYKYLFKSDGFISKINTFSMSLRDGKNIAFSDFGNMYIPIPPKEEQESIAAYLDEKCAAIEQSIADKQTQIETLKAYKASLIYEYVTGKKQVI